MDATEAGDTHGSQQGAFARSCPFSLSRVHWRLQAGTPGTRVDTTSVRFEARRALFAFFATLMCACLVVAQAGTLDMPSENLGQGGMMIAADAGLVPPQPDNLAFHPSIGGTIGYGIDSRLDVAAGVSSSGTVPIPHLKTSYQFIRTDIFRSAILAAAAIGPGTPMALHLYSDNTLLNLEGGIRPLAKIGLGMQANGRAWMGFVMGAAVRLSEAFEVSLDIRHFRNILDPSGVRGLVAFSAGCVYMF